MLCEQCHERDATVHLTQVVDGAVKKLHLCEQCAKEAGLDLHGPVSITDILLGMGGETDAARPAADRSCAHCHLRRSDFKKLGRLGCAACYDAFADELAPLLKAMHRKETHVGKRPSDAATRGGGGAELAALQKALDAAIAAEQFEEAARLRDLIQTGRSKRSAGGKTRARSPRKSADPGKAAS
ncbi:MAG: UvrB/UvrC motif-containing protein [Kiritimatiellae bacterium]|nr:UvrB/UvrC motif-containing protein [Kiritimatiellia bacterium]